MLEAQFIRAFKTTFKNYCNQNNETVQTKSKNLCVLCNIKLGRKKYVKQN